MINKMWKVLLCFIVFFGSITTPALAVTTGKAPSSPSSPSYITTDWLLQQYGRQDEWIFRELEKGYDLFDIYWALQQEKEKKGTYEQLISNVDLQERAVLLDDKTKVIPSKSIMTINSSDPYDEIGLKRQYLSDNQTDYYVVHGAEQIAAATGNLQVRSADAILPGMIPFALVRYYDVSKSGGDLGVEWDTSKQEYVNVETTRREEELSGLGRGWSWDLPYIKEQYGTRYFYMSGIGNYEISDQLELIGYPWSDILIQLDQSITVKGTPSFYKVRILNGYDYYFDAEGYLLLIEDAYHNRVEFEYNHVQGSRRLTSISNSDGNQLAFQYGSQQVTIQQVGTNYSVTYKKEERENIEILAEVIDAEGISTKYLYYAFQTPYNFLTELAGDIYYHPKTTHMLLSRIIHPSSALTDYYYVPNNYQVGPVATKTVFKVLSREDSYATTTNKKVANTVTYKYSGNELEWYGQSATFTTTENNYAEEVIYTFDKKFRGANQPAQHLLKERKEKVILNEDKKIIDQFIYDESSSKPTPIRWEITHYDGSNASTTLSTSYQYDDRGVLLSERYSTGGMLQYEYISSPEAERWFLPAKKIVTMSANQSQVTVYRRSAQGDVTRLSVMENSENGPLLAQTDYEYDSFGNLRFIKIKDNSRETVIEQQFQSPYGKYLMTSASSVVTDVEQQTSVIKQQYEYNRMGLLQRSQDSNGYWTAYSYDRVGRLIETTYPNGSKTKIQYDDISNKETITYPEGIVDIYQYNPLGWLAYEQLGQSLFQYDYDMHGNVIESIDAENRTIRYQYDAYNRLIETSYPDQAKSMIEYDDVYRMITYTDPAGVKTREIFDELGRSIRTEQWSDGSYQKIEEREYNDVDQVIAITDGNNNRTLYTYDALSRLIAVTDAEQKTTSYTYSLAGDLTHIKFPDNRVVRKDYDELGRIIRHTNPGNEIEKWIYDGNSNVISYVDRKSLVTHYTYDENDRLTQVMKGSDTVHYTYDLAGRRLTMSDIHGTTTYGYDPIHGFLISLTYPDGTKINYETNLQQRIGYEIIAAHYPYHLKVRGLLDERNRAEALEIFNGNSVIDTITFEYQDNNLLKQQTFGGRISTEYQYKQYSISDIQMNQGGSALNYYNYQYDNNRNITARTENRQSETFTYDGLNRILTESSRGLTYQYDESNNRLSLEESKIQQMQNMGYAYDDYNRLISVTNEQQETVEYAYNGDGLLYERIEHGETTRYYYDEEAKLIAEAKVGADGRPQLTYVYIYDLEGRLWARQDGLTDELQYYLFNGHGDVVALLDAQGNELNSYSYDIWGNIESDQETVSNVMRYAGEYWDSTTKLQYLRARWYDPSIGRFITEDTYEGDIFDPLSLNRYTYVNHNPLKYIDPSGHSLSDVCGLKCFSAGTEVLTEDGYKPIEEIEIGDKVLAKDEYSGDLDYKEVVELFQRETDEIYEVQVNGTTIVTTEEHPFWILGKGWVEARDLEVGDRLVSDTGTEHPIEVIEIKQERTTVYNIRVEGYHTYFVTELSIWTHNCGGGGGGRGGSGGGRGVASSGGSGGRVTLQSPTANTSTPSVSANPSVRTIPNVRANVSKVKAEGTGKGLETRGYKPQPGERTFDGYVKKNVPVDKETTLHTNSKGFNNNSRGSNPDGQFKRFGSDSHAGLSPHVHQPTRNVNKNGEIFGGQGSKTQGGGVTSPGKKDVSQLYDYLNNGKYRR